MKIHYALLKRERIIRGWTQRQVADLANVSKSTVAKIEQGKRRGPYVKRVADALGVPMEKLIDEMDEIIVKDAPR